MASLNLFICRPLITNRPLRYFPSEEASSTHDSFHAGDPHEVIYMWSPEEDLWGGIGDEALRAHLKSSFVQSLSGHGIEELANFIKELKTAVEQEQNVNWVLSQTTQDDDGEALTLFVVPHLASLNHLIWIYETFRNVPGLKLEVR